MSDFADTCYKHLKTKDIFERRELPPDAKTDRLASVLSFVVNAVERVCLAEGTLFEYGEDFATNSLHKPLAGVTEILVQLRRDVVRYSERAQRLMQYADFDMSEFLFI